MAGTGNLDVIRIVRMLRLKGISEPAIGNTHLHGTYLAAHMTLGLLFLGGGRYVNMFSLFTFLVLYSNVREQLIVN